MTDEDQAHRAFTFTLTLLVVLLLTTLASQLPATVAPQWLLVGDATTRAVWPQGWFFFAHAPQEPGQVFYSIRPGDRLGEVMARSQLTPESLWGIRRTGLSQLVETVVMFEQIPQEMWTSCAGLNAEQCWGLVRQRPPYEGVNHAVAPQFCGRLMAAVEGPPAWNERSGVALPRRPLIQAVSVELVCPR